MNIEVPFLTYALNLVQTHRFYSMSEETLDNLPQDHKADGTQETSNGANENANAMAAEREAANDNHEPLLDAEPAVDTEPVSEMEETPEVVPAEIASEAEPGDVVVASEAAPETASEPTEALQAEVSEQTVTLSETQLADETPVVEDNSHLDVLQTIDEANAEAGEHAHDEAVPMADYASLSMEALVDELEKVSAHDNVTAVREHAEEIRKAFLAQFHHFLDDKRKQWHEENPDTTEDFHYHSPLKQRFDQLYHKYRDRKNAHFKNVQGNLEANLKTRLAIVEELKNLINPQENIKDTLKHFNELRERWKNAGPIPRDKYNHVWNNYHFHVENFYDYLHLDREARDIDFRHNLEQKQRIIERAEALLGQADVNKAFRELQDLHKIWKEDIGPVSREHREEIWNKFSDITRQMHDKREAIVGKLRASENENLAQKQDVISRINALAQEKVNAHALWLQQIQKVEALRAEFFALGKVPAEANESTWQAFKDAVRAFNSLKNSFYKDIKKDQNDNLSRKQALVARAQALKESEDFAATTPVMKQIQEEWKAIGHVPRKFSDKLWDEFKAACNQYFERLKESKKEENSEEVEAFEKKKAYLETLRGFELTGDHKTDLDAIKKHIEYWKSVGRVPFPRRHIEGKFNKILDALFEKLSLSKKETDMVRFSNRVNQLAGSDDSRKLDNEKIFLMRKIDEVQAEIFQLENNIQFFTSKDKNPKKENPMIVEVRRSIEKHKDELVVLKDKLKQLRDIRSQE